MNIQAKPIDKADCVNALEKAGVPPVDRLALYIKLALELNQSINITGSKTPEEFALKHIADVWYALQALGRPVKQVYDVGSGGGIPGIPIAIMVPDVRVTLVERRLNKIKALDHFVSKLGMESRVRVKGETLENIKNLPEDAEYWFRGFLPGPKLAQFFSKMFPRANIGPIVLMKGPGWGSEKLDIMGEKSIKDVWRNRFSDAQEVEYELPNNAGWRTLVLV